MEQKERKHEGDEFKFRHMKFCAGGHKVDTATGPCFPTFEAREDDRSRDWYVLVGGAFWGTSVDSFSYLYPP